MPAELRKVIAATAALAVGACLIAVAARAADPNTLWNIVHGQCVPDERQHGDPHPCAKVDLVGGEVLGFAVLKDIKGTTQFLLIPTRRISGIESPALLAPGAPNYFAAAWEERDRVAWALLRPMPRESLSLAINSEVGRSQNQLHIHIDCVHADVRDALWRARSLIGRRWAWLPVPLRGHHYRAMRLDGETLGDRNPFKLLARGVPGAGADMGHHTLVVAGMWYDDGGPGFVILDDHADLAHHDWASGEDLQDHTCALGR
jgi:CDP-diacylglycerol pyrophosphatase